ncbi:transcriptional regulator [Pseudaminobacter manganicus]|uniref:Transcriptional regulator n=2 Tax=Manganibacter manganicus TaxID=1873176 RepID=A0A1V8RM59_9HYPH|nr:transcriptional regulator [Pseudaminobacter manganicus]
MRLDGGLASVGGRRKRSDMIADQMRDLIISRDLKPGDRLPSDWLGKLESTVAKGTMREAMKALETEGLIRRRTGPGGGAFVSALSGDQAIRLVSNLFLFRQPSIADIYALRKLLEPELAAGLAGKLDEPAYAALQAMIHLYDHEPATAEEEFAQRLAELDFHSLLAAHSENAILGFICIFLHKLLHELAVCRAIYDKPNPALREVGLRFQVPLLRFLRNNDADGARALMLGHMIEAEQYMLERAETVRPRTVSGQSSII